MKHLLTISLVTNIVLIATLIGITYDRDIQLTQELVIPEILSNRQIHLAGDDMSKRALQELNMKRIIKGEIQGVTYLTEDGCVIYARTPRSVDDRERMAILGHELLPVSYTHLTLPTKRIV